MEFTTIRIKKETLEELEKLKIHPRQTIREIIEKLLDNKE